MGDILEPVVLRILLDHQHVIGNQTNVTQILNMNDPHTVIAV